MPTPRRIRVNNKQKTEVTEYKDTLEVTDLIEDDENFLGNLEIYRMQLEKVWLKGTIWEPSLIVC